MTQAAELHLKQERQKLDKEEREREHSAKLNKCKLDREKVARERAERRDAETAEQLRIESEATALKGDDKQVCLHEVAPLYVCIPFQNSKASCCKCCNHCIQGVGIDSLKPRNLGTQTQIVQSMDH